MTTRATKATARKTPRKSKLALSKQTIRDLTTGKRQSGAVRGGIGKTNTCGCF